MNRFLFFFIILIGCNQPYAKFQSEDNSIFVCAQDGNAIITDLPCSKKSSSHLLLKDSGITGGMSIFVNLCNTNEVLAFGDFEVIGSPKFIFELNPWNKYISQKDSLKSAYESKDCKFHYSE